MIKFEHSVFALPFAYMGAILARFKLPSWPDLFWITVAMVGARTLAMSLNRLIDKEIDARNPRTKNRALPQRLLSEKDVVLFSLLAMAILIFAVYQLAPLTRFLWPLVIIPFIVYPYAKRFTWTSHFLLGACLGLAPIGAWIAITNSCALTPILIGLAVTLWVAGFDIIYACQDVEIDRRQKLYSIPARFGIKTALNTTKILHLLSVALFIYVGYLSHLGIIFYIGVTITAILLAYENYLVKPDDLSRLNVAFFNMNGIISITLFAFTFLDLLFKRVTS
jgi:4-hydroxybenzoate polyprenyltransferase